MTQTRISAQQGAAEATKDPSDPAVYAAEIQKVRAQLVGLDSQSDSISWKHALLSYQEVERLSTEFADIATKKKIYFDLAAGHGSGIGTIKKGALTIGVLFANSREEIAIQPFSMFNQIADITNAGLPQDVMLGLLNEVYTHDKANPENRYTVTDVRAKILELKDKDQSVKSWHRHTDLWEFNDHDPRWGLDGYAGRIPGQAVANILDRWLPANGLFLNAMCGGGTALDVAKDLKMTTRYYGFDLTPGERVLKRHPGRVATFDAIDNSGNWNGIEGLPNEPFDLVLVTPPHFNFTQIAMSGKPTDLGNITRPDDYITVWKPICAGIRSVLVNGGVVAVVTKNTSEFDNGTPVPDIESGILGTMAEFGLTDTFLARPIIRVKKERPKAPSDRKPFLIPEIQTVHIFRVSA